MAALSHQLAPGLLFQKVLGSGRHGGFGLWPSLHHQGFLGAFETPLAARAFLASGQRVEAYREHAQDLFWALLRPYSSRGSWSGHSLDIASPAPQPGALVASLTRASIRPSKALSFWSRSPDAERDLAQAPGCELAVGLGEAPFLRQATFSIWRGEDAMRNYAHTGGHRRAIEAAHAGKHFSESMFTRFCIDDMSGRWAGRTFA